MAKIQRFCAVIDGETHELLYTRRALRRTVTLRIDGEDFTLPRGERQEPFILGGEQAILHIRRDGSAAITVREGEVKEIQ